MPEVGYCRDCSWWEPDHPANREGAPAGFAWCRALYGATYAEPPRPILNLVDALGPVFTAPDFGCLLFEKKES